MTEEWGVDFQHDAGSEGEYHMPEIMTGGIALFDADADGDLDLYCVNSGVELGQAPAASEPNRLFRNDLPRGFTDVTKESGLGDRGYGSGMAIGDLNGDGHLDVYVTNYGPDRLYFGVGEGRYEDATEAARIDVPTWSSSAACFDYDRDGDLDLYVVQYVEYDSSHNCTDGAGRKTFCGPKNFDPVTDVLLRNEGDGTFTDVSEAAGLRAALGAGLGVVCDDFDGDGWVDVYVANDAYGNQCWINQRDGTFRDRGLDLGVAFNVMGNPEGGMGVISNDLDGDGARDLFVTHFQEETNTYYRRREFGFSDATGHSGLGPSSMRWTGFGVAAFDADLDGDLDVAVANGGVRHGEVLETADVPEPWNYYVQPNLFYENEGAGRFALANGRAPEFSETPEISRALAVGDIDGDGDLDFVTANIEGPARVYRNDAPRQGQWLLVDARDSERGGGSMLGALVRLHEGDEMTERVIRSAFSYLASSDPRAHFGLSPETEAADLELEIVWPDGERERFAVEGLERVLTCTRGAGQAPLER